MCSDTAVFHITGNIAVVAENLYNSRSSNSVGVTKTVTYINRLSNDVTVVERNGLKYRIKHIPDNYSREFVIRTTYTIMQQLFEDFQRLFIHPDTESYDDAEFLAIKEAFYHQYDKNRFTNIQLITECIITQEELKLRKHLYINTKDVVVSNTTPNDACLHPYNKNNLSKIYQAKQSLSNSGANFFIDIVDNDNVISDRFIYLAKRIFTLHPIADATRESGVYFGIAATDHEGKRTSGTTRFELTEAEEKLGLYKTREEAISAGDVKALRLEEIARLNHDVNTVNIKLSQQQQEYKTEIERAKVIATEREIENKTLLTQAEQRVKEIERENQRIKAAFDTRKMELEEEYNRRNNDRKNSGEMLKFGAMLITTCLGMYIAVSKAQENKK